MVAMPDTNGSAIRPYICAAHARNSNEGLGFPMFHGWHPITNKMASLKLPRLDTSPAMKAPETDGEPLSPTEHTLQDGQNGARPPTPPLSAEPKTKMAYALQWKRELEQYRAIFNQNMKNKPVKHDEVHVFMWTWDDKLDDLKVKKEVSILHNTIDLQKVLFRTVRS